MIHITFLKHPYIQFHCVDQVSTWFANARRRLKKENKLFPGDRDDKDDDDDDDDVAAHRDDMESGSEALSLSGEL